MPKFSANLGFLWTDRSLPEAVRAAKAAGFDAVEVHWPYDVAPGALKDALEETGLPLLGLNTSRGNVGAGENGLSALPGRESEARAAIDEAADYAKAVGAGAIHVMAGFSGGPLAHATFLSNLAYAAERAGAGITILIEPLNHYDAPGYFLSTSEQAAGIIRELGHPRVKLMFDIYHLQVMEGDVSRRLERLLPLVGHIQFAAVPDRGPPDHGEVSMAHVFALVDKLGWALPIGAEYKPGGPTDETLGWLASARLPGA